MLRFRAPKPSYQDGILLILRAFHSIPPDFHTWHIKYWTQIVELANKIIEMDAKQGMFK